MANICLDIFGIIASGRLRLQVSVCHKVVGFIKIICEFHNLSARCPILPGAMHPHRLPVLLHSGKMDQASGIVHIARVLLICGSNSATVLAENLP